MLRGDERLPWEGELSAQHAQRLGMYKGIVLQLLDRDPSRRLDLAAVNAACTGGFSSRVNGWFSTSPVCRTVSTNIGIRLAPIVESIQL